MCAECGCGVKSITNRSCFCEAFDSQQSLHQRTGCVGVCCVIVECGGSSSTVPQDRMPGEHSTNVRLNARRKFFCLVISGTVFEKRLREGASRRSFETSRPVGSCVSGSWGNSGTEAHSTHVLTQLVKDEGHDLRIMAPSRFGRVFAGIHRRLNNVGWMSVSLLASCNARTARVRTARWSTARVSGLC